MSEKKYSKSPMNFFSKVAIVFLAVFLIVSLVTMNIKNNEIAQQIEDKKAELKKMQYVVDELESKLAAEMNEETIKRIARESLNLLEPGDIIYANDLPN